MGEKTAEQQRPIAPKAGNARAQSPHKLRLGKRIKALRTCREYTQDKLAELVGISQKYLGEVERGEGNVSIDILTKIAEVLCVPLTSVLDNAHEQSPTELREEVLRMLPLLNAKDLKIAYRMLKLLVGE
jgi:transcriptional regulator with XRE-family HTH domain